MARDFPGVAVPASGAGRWLHWPRTRRVPALLPPDLHVQPTLDTARLRLRPFTVADAADVQRLAGDSRVAEFATAIPHPYPDGAAAQWIAGHAAAFRDRTEVVYAITQQDGGALLGAISLLDVQMPHARAELGYWIAVDHWGQGYCSEAAGRLVAYAHEGLGISRVVARCLARNPASARVMEKVGLSREGVLPLHVRKAGRYEDMLLYGVVLAGR